MVESEALNALCRLFEQGDPERCFASRVTIVLRDGTSFDSGLVEGSAHFPNPGWSGERLADKFRWLARYVLDDERIDRLLEMAWRFEEVSTVRQLTDLVRS